MVGKLLSKKEVILIIVILVVGFSALGIRQIWQGFFSQGSYSSNRIFAEIIFGHGVQTIYLDTDKIFYLPSVPNVLFEVRDEQIAFVKSDCPDQICVRTGFRSRPGQMAACLPNGLVLSVISDSPGDDELDIFVEGHKVNDEFKY